MEINWTVLTYFVVGLFALSGFSRGWWKEAVTTIFLVLLVFLLQNPAVAAAVVDFVNNILALIWDFIPISLLPTVNATLETVFGIETAGRVLQIDPGDPGTWFLILIGVIALAVLAGRFMLPGGIRQSGTAYVATPSGGLLGGLLGGFNGFLIINLVREYLDGRALPGGRPATELAMSGADGGVATASSGVMLRAVEVPTFTILDSFLPWLIIGLGLLILLAAYKNRMALRSNKGFRRIDYKVPYGYKKVDL